MKNLLSVYFGNYRIYLSAIIPTYKGYELLYVNNINGTFDSVLNEVSDNELKSGIYDFASKIDGQYRGLTLTIPSSSVYISSIPFSESLSANEIKKILELEINLMFPNKTNEDFKAFVIKLYNNNSNTERQLAVIIPKTYIDSCIHYLSPLKLNIDKISVSHIDAIAALNYNYPENLNRRNIQLCIGRSTVEISSTLSGKIQDYNIYAINNIDNLTDQLTEVINKYLLDSDSIIQPIYIYGEGLNHSSTELLKERYMDSNIEIVNMNAFRMFTTKLDPAHRRYSSLMSHIFPPVIGSSLPGHHNPINRIHP